MGYYLWKPNMGKIKFVETDRPYNQLSKQFVSLNLYSEFICGTHIEGQYYYDEKPGHKYAVYAGETRILLAIVQVGGKGENKKCTLAQFSDKSVWVRNDVRQSRKILTVERVGEFLPTEIADMCGEFF